MDVNEDQNETGMRQKCWNKLEFIPSITVQKIGFVF